MTTSGAEATSHDADPHIAGWLMTVTYVLGGGGYFLGFREAAASGAVAGLRPVALFSVGAVGIVSMVRHSIFFRSDAARMGWDIGRRNNFQIEVGFANLAIGVIALLAVGRSWGTAAEAVAVLAYALYFLQVAVLCALVARDEGGDAIKRCVIMAAQAALLGWFALAALAALATV